jgi:hypothetical protein
MVADAYDFGSRQEAARGLPPDRKRSMQKRGDRGTSHSHRDSDRSFSCGGVRVE